VSVADFAREWDRRYGGRLGAVSRSDALARISARPPSWRVAEILSSDDYGTLAGPKGIGKTFALLDLATGVALGQPWLGRFETEQARCLALTAEDSEARLWRRIDAIARSRGVDPGDLEGTLFVHPFPFDAIRDLDHLKAELEAVEPGLVVIDPAYKYLNGARPSSLFDMGAALTPLQLVCGEAGTALLVGHHYNRQDSRDREGRISGAGLLEWARVVITADGTARRDNSDAVVTFEITGNSIDPVTFTIRRRVVAEDGSPNPELAYSVEFVAEGETAVGNRFMTAAERVLAVLPHTPEEALSIREIGDAVAKDFTGKGGLKHDTIRRSLNRDLDGRVNSIGNGLEVRWWRL